jgi:hypothetical protein
MSPATPSNTLEETLASMASSSINCPSLNLPIEIRLQTYDDYGLLERIGDFFDEDATISSHNRNLFPDLA